MRSAFQDDLPGRAPLAYILPRLRDWYPTEFGQRVYVQSGHTRRMDGCRAVGGIKFNLLIPIEYLCIATSASLALLDFGTFKIGLKDVPRRLGFHRDLQQPVNELFKIVRLGRKVNGIQDFVDLVARERSKPCTCSEQPVSEIRGGNLGLLAFPDLYQASDLIGCLRVHGARNADAPGGKQ